MNDTSAGLASVWNRCAWASLIAWCVFVFLERGARRALELDSAEHASRNGNGGDHAAPKKVEEVSSA